MPVRKRTEKNSRPTTAMLPLPKRNFLVDKPAPRLVTRVFHRTPITLFEGRVRLEDIEGWVDNSRIAVLVKKFEHQYSRKPTNKDLYNLLLQSDREFKIKELARSIYWNGVRVPIIVDSDGKLLDGNRRYFATLHLLKTDPDNRSNYETINALVLPPDVPDDVKNKVIIEMNFVDDPKLDWSPYVKAKLVHHEHEMMRVPDLKELADRFGWTNAKVRESIETINIVNQFIAFHSEPSDPNEGLKRLGDAMEAEIIAAETYTLFWEARNKYGTHLEQEADFKEWFFEMMVISPFKSITEVRFLWDCWQDEQSRDELKRRTPSGVERALVINKAKKMGIPVDNASEADIAVRQEKYEKRIREFAKWLTELGLAKLTSMAPETLEALHSSLDMVLKAHDALSDVATDGGEDDT